MMKHGYVGYVGYVLHAEFDHIPQLVSAIGFHIEDQLGEAGLTWCS